MPAPRHPELPPEDCATAWFAVLEAALETGDLQRAAQAQRELYRLGVPVKFARRPPHQEAAQ